jgi:2-methylcitrate dehydratase PrpD
MSSVNRRRFVRSVAAAGVAAGTIPAVRGEESLPGAGTKGSPKDVTRILARYVVNAKYEDLPAPVRKEAQRTLLNWAGVAIGGSKHETLDIAIAALSPFAGSGQATVLGRKEKMDVMHAALMNGISSHIFDYDDTHLRTIIHPGGPVASAILALSEYRPVSGRDFLNALVLGAEVECRIGNSVYPAHYEIGWHITGTTGVFGAAAAAGKLLGLNEQQMVWALGLAATQPVGLKEMFGTMTKSFHPGRAAQNGLTAAFLASKNYTSSNQGIEAKEGWANALSTGRDFREITDNLGKTYEISINTYKPFACGIVIHPTLDACIQLRNENKLTADQIERVELHVNRLVESLTGKKTPQTGLEGKFSVYYAAAVALIKGAAGEKQFSDALVKDPQVVALRDRVATIIEPDISSERVHVVITLKDGRKLEKYIENAIGSVKNPMSDQALEAKFTDLADGVIPGAKARKVMDLCWGVEKLTSAAEIAKAGAA